MKSRWDEMAAREAVARYGADGVGEDLALRTYSARLLGADPTLVLHGGGNTSVKTTALDLFGDEIEVLCVKGSGWDLATIEPAGHPAVRLDPLLRLRELERLSDEDMVNAQRQNLLDSAAPNPSVETLLHAFIGKKFIDHTHALAVLALVDQPDADARIADLYGADVGVVPYVMPGFELARRAAAVFDLNPSVKGLVLLGHGVFSFADSALESYERMIALVDRAETAVRRAPPVAVSRPPVNAAAARILPIVRGLMGEADNRGHWVFDLRAGEAALTLAGDTRLADWATRGVATPDHVIRTKGRPLVLPALSDDRARWRRRAHAALASYAAEYQAYFDRNAGRTATPKRRLDALPRVIALPGMGLVGVGRTSSEAAIAGDIAEAWAWTLLAAESVGRYQPVGEPDVFDIEYWSLEQAKLGKRVPRRLEGQVVVISGAAGAIGRATAFAFANEGAETVLIDIDGEGAIAAAAAVSSRALGLKCDVTDPGRIERALDAVCERFGGLDIVVSNAGVALPGAMTDLDDARLRASFEINFFAHQNLARGAVERMRAQGLGGVLLFNVSKQAVNPGPDFGAYGTSKAALLALVRQYALEHGADGVRVNAVNPDRIRSGLLTEAMIAERAKARGVSDAEYMAGNLLGAEVGADDVAQALVFAALMKRTTGAVISVDGGNVAAMMR